MFLVPIVAFIAAFSFAGVAVWVITRRKEREALYRSETLKMIAQASGEGTKAAMDMIREQERTAVRRRRESIILGGLILVAVGASLMIFLHAIAATLDDSHTYLAGLIPLFMGIVTLFYSYALSPKPE